MPVGIGRYFAPLYLDEVLKRKCVHIGNYDYHMPRYYADKIYKKTIPLGLVKGSEKKIVVKSPLSVALANRAFELRCERDNQSRIESGLDSSSAFEFTRLSENVALVSRYNKTKQSLQSFYQRSRF